MFSSYKTKNEIPADLFAGPEGGRLRVSHLISQTLGGENSGMTTQL